ncbi:hypothetical protein E2320_013161 [Naja naja]|nr:hypothetical protein E2320_013161 [Naja naja]
MNIPLYGARGISLRCSSRGLLTGSPGSWIFPPFCLVRARRAEEVEAAAGAGVVEAGAAGRVPLRRL